VKRYAIDCKGFGMIRDPLEMPLTELLNMGPQVRIRLGPPVFSHFFLTPNFGGLCDEPATFASATDTLRSRRPLPRTRGSCMSRLVDGDYLVIQPVDGTRLAREAVANGVDCPGLSHRAH
jgi:hypothetical protein